MQLGNAELVDLLNMTPDGRLQLAAACAQARTPEFTYWTPERLRTQFQPWYNAMNYGGTTRECRPMPNPLKSWRKGVNPKYFSKESMRTWSRVALQQFIRSLWGILLR